MTRFDGVVDPETGSWTRGAATAALSCAGARDGPKVLDAVVRAGHADLMTVAPHERGGSTRRPAAPDVLACMPDGPLAPIVARTAVREAVRRGARVRFLRVIRAGTTDRERAAADDRTFSVALRALRDAPRARVAFETVEGDLASVVLDRSSRAGVLVIAGEPRRRHGGDGRSQPDDGDATAAALPQGIAELCRGRAGCPVLVVER